MSRQTPLYQEYQLKTIRDEQKILTRILKYQAAIGQKYMEHLKEAMSSQMKSGQNKVILIAGSTPCGYQAATLCLSNIPRQDQTPELSIPDEDEFDQRLKESLLDFEDPVEYEEKVYDNSRDILIENANIFASDSGVGFEFQDPFSMQRQMISIDKISKATNLLLHCNPNVQDKEEVIEGIAGILEQCENIFLLIPKDGVSSYFVEQLVFQYEFTVLNIKEPSATQLHALFLDLAAEAGLVIREEVDVNEVIQRLKLYRTKNFWEKDLEKLITATKKKVKDGQAGRDDLKPYYYIGEEKPGEEQLKELIGQEEAKKAILRLTALMKFTMKQREKYGDKGKFYHHLCFAGPPGTGKTEFARITARMFAMCGISNGKYKEVSKESLTAPYLGQTPIKIAKLFDEEVRGGVLFIDEAGSLVTDDRDSYTKEAISALVRHMENAPETTVILATYPDEMERLLSSDPGLRSRVTRVIHFQSYSQEELWKIFCYMAKKEHLSVDENAKPEVYRYISLCACNNPDFGNAREMRKLLQAAKEELAERNMNSEIIGRQDVIKACDGLLGAGIIRLPSIGFSIPASR